jgi:hypothetical protein
MAGAGDVIDWPQEEIPDQAQLFMRVHDMWRKDVDVNPGAFKNHNGGMSTDWAKYSTPEETRQRARSPDRNAVVSLGVGAVRAIPGQEVVHTPDTERRNRAHTDVFGDKDEEARVKLRRIAEIVIPFEAAIG